MKDGNVIPRLSTGVYGLDDILHGGLPSGFVYLLEGDPGAGKTTLGLQFLIAGAAKGEKGLYVSLAESKHELLQVADSHGFDLSCVEIAEIVPPELSMGPDQQYTVFHPAEVELADVMQSVLQKIKDSQPKRVVIDSMSELRMLSRDPTRYRRQVLSLKQFFTTMDCTTILLDDRYVSSTGETQLRTVVHGAITLENLGREYGILRRRLQVLKVRASRFREGFHDYVLERGGMRVFPRLVSAEHRAPESPQDCLPSGLPELDSLFGGGIGRGSSTLVIGPSGAGKSTLCSKFVLAAADRGESGAIFTFDEVLHTFVHRSRGLGINLEPHIQSGRIHLEQLDPAELSPGEFFHRIRDGVENRNWRIVVIDSLNGFTNCMAGEHSLNVQLHELLAYLSQMGVAGFLVLAQYGVLGQHITSPEDVSYLADNVLLLRFFESAGSVRQAVSVVKRRSGSHERSIRELVMQNGAVTVGKPLADFDGVLTGHPRYLGNENPLL
jgi:circadian clock protein KaiC